MYKKEGKTQSEAMYHKSKYRKWILYSLRSSVLAFEKLRQIETTVNLIDKQIQ